MAITHISVRGARQHNLRDINVRIPRNTLTVVTGLSGSGKSSLAFDTIYAEGQRRYVETLSAYARQFLDQIERPDVDSIEGLSPAISIEQKTTSRSPRSTVGTITEIYDYLRLLYASVGTPHCPNCGRPISRQTAEQIVQRILAARHTASASPSWRPSSAAARASSKICSISSTSRAFAPASTARCATSPSRHPLDKRKNHTIEAIVDRILLKPECHRSPHSGTGETAGRSTRQAFRRKASRSRRHQGPADGQRPRPGRPSAGGEEQLFSSSMACPDCGLDVPKLEPRSFSFNSTFGACPECHGLGSLYDFDPAKVITDWSKPLLDGGLGPGSASQYLLKLINLAADRYKIDLKMPFEDLPPKQQHILRLRPAQGRSAAHRLPRHPRLPARQPSKKPAATAIAST